MDVSKETLVHSFTPSSPLTPLRYRRFLLAVWSMMSWTSWSWLVQALVTILFLFNWKETWITAEALFHFILTWIFPEFLKMSPDQMIKNQTDLEKQSESISVRTDDCFFQEFWVKIKTFIKQCLSRAAPQTSQTSPSHTHDCRSVMQQTSISSLVTFNKHGSDVCVCVRCSSVCQFLTAKLRKKKDFLTIKFHIFGKKF